MNLHTIFLPTQQNADSAFGRFVLDAFDLAAASTAYNMYRIIAQDMCKKALNTRPLPSEATPTFIAQSLMKDASHECLDEVLQTHLGGATAEERIIYITRVLCGFAFYNPTMKNSLRLQDEDDIEEEARILAVKIFAAYMGRSVLVCHTPIDKMLYQAVKIRGTKIDSSFFGTIREIMSVLNSTAHELLCS